MKTINTIRSFPSLRDDRPEGSKREYRRYFTLKNLRLSAFPGAGAWWAWIAAGDPAHSKVPHWPLPDR